MKKFLTLLLLLLIPFQLSARILESSEELQLNPTAGSYVGVSGTVNRFRVNGGVLQFSNDSGVSWGDFFSLTSIAATNGQTLLGNGSGLQIGTITGTANQVIVTLGSGTLGLSTPQSIGTTSSPTFSNPTLTDGAVIGTGAGASLTFTGTIPLIKTSSDSVGIRILGGLTTVDTTAPQLILSDDKNVYLYSGSGTPSAVKFRTDPANPSEIGTDGKFKQADFGASALVVTGTGSGLSTSATVSAAEAEYLDGVTSAIQTQLNAKQGTLTNSAGLLAALSDETGTGLAVFSTNPVLTAPEIADYILYGEIVTPSNPAANKHKCYFKTADNLYYCLNSSGVEAQIGGGGIGGAANQLVYATGSAGSGSSEAAYTYDPTLNQLNLDGDFKIGVSGTPATKLDVEGAISSNGVGILADNLLLDGGFEDGAHFTCTHTDQTCAIATTSVLTGAGYQVIDASTSQTYNGRYCVTNTQWAGRDIQITADMKTTSTVMSLCASYNDSATLTGDNCTQYVVNSAMAWVPIKTSMTVPASGVMCARLISSAGTTDDVGLENIKFEPLQLNVASNSKASTEYTPTLTGFGTPTSVKFFYWRNGDKLFFRGSFVAGTTTAVDAKVSLPTGLLIDYAKLQSANTLNALGIAHRVNATSSSFASGIGMQLFADGSDTDELYFVINAYASDAVYPKDDGNQVASGDGVDMYTTVGIPIVGWTDNSEFLTGTSPKVAEIKFYNQTGCSALIDGASFQDLADAADCLFSTASKTPNVITPTTSGALALKQTLVAKGSYDISFSGTMLASNIATQECAFRLTDGTNIIGPIHAASDGTSVNGFTSGASGTVTYTSDQANLEWKLQAYEITNAGGSCYAEGNNTLNSINIKMVPAASTIVAALNEKVVSKNISKPVLVSAKVTDGVSVGTVSEDDSDFINGNCTNTGNVGSYVCTYTTNFFKSGSSLSCWAQQIGNKYINAVSAGASTVSIDVRSVAVDGVDDSFYIFCKGESN